MTSKTKKPHFWGFNYCGGDGMIRLYAKAYMSEARVLALRGANDYSSNVLQSNTVHKGAQTLRQSKQKSPKNRA